MERKASNDREPLAALSPFVRLGLISAFPEFLPTFLAGVRGVAQHGTHVRGTVQDADDVDAVLADGDVVIYATGAEGVTARPRPCMEALEDRRVARAARGSRDAKDVRVARGFPGIRDAHLPPRHQGVTPCTHTT